MSKKTGRKLALKKETVRTLTEQQLREVAGAGLSGIYCGAGGGGSATCGSQTDTCTADSCACGTLGGSIIIRN